MSSILDKLASIFNPAAGIPSISAPELHKALKGKSRPVLVDVRTPAETAQGVIAGARLIPLDELSHRIGELSQHQPIVCVCRSGRRSAKACRTLQAAGFADVTNLSGGMNSWQVAKLPVKKGK